MMNDEQQFSLLFIIHRSSFIIFACLPVLTWRKSRKFLCSFPAKVGMVLPIPGSQMLRRFRDGQNGFVYGNDVAEDMLGRQFAAGRPLLRLLAAGAAESAVGQAGA